ncbi:MAG TPA: hypothetical protein VFG69_02355 [Nannocystaceae bacterium]|nr:hypothetical protein [Nannocystaceae bacterium]
MADKKPSSVPAPRPKADKPAIATLDGDAEPAKKEGWLGWTLGWIIAPLSVLGAIFGGGVLLGAHFPDGWFSRAVVWVVGLFA